MEYRIDFGVQRKITSLEPYQKKDWEKMKIARTIKVHELGTSGEEIKEVDIDEEMEILRATVH